MNKIEIFVRHDAELDAFGYFQYIHEHNPDAALRFLESIDQTVEDLALQPLKGGLRKFRGRDLKNIRSWRVDDFENYLIFYRLTEMRLEILRIK
ncbi:MAG: type II toxin-antitoxin system RelE/ParE family toxin, partial [Limisphaerales bacterium]